MLAAFRGPRPAMATPRGRLRLVKNATLARAISACLGALTLSAAPAPPPAEVAAGPATRQEIVITGQNLAVVRETRRVELPSGDVALAWPDLPASARTETWGLLDPREAGVKPLGLAAPHTAHPLADLVGRRVRVERPGGASVDADVVSASGPSPDQMVFREGGDLVYGEPGARVVLPGGGGAPGTADRLVLRLSSDRAGARDLTARYLVADLGWQADYALTLAPDEKTGRLEGSFVVDNASGVAFVPSRLRLLAGTLRLTSTPTPRQMRANMAVQAGAVNQEVAVSQPASESRTYEIASPGRLPEGRSTFPLADDAGVAVEKRYLARATFWFGESADSQPLPVAVVYRVASKALSAALPAGIVRVYTEGGAVFVGEDRLAHTPERTDFEIESSEAFDLTGRRRQISFAQSGPRDSESTWEATFTSRKKEPVTVLVRDNFPGDWTLVESSVPGTKTSARSVEFAVPVPAGGDAKLTYRVRVRTGR